jgi:hypothetical protein
MNKPLQDKQTEDKLTYLQQDSNIAMQSYILRILATAVVESASTFALS